jgi:NCS1 family nucleobase:cation symporter-1
MQAADLRPVAPSDRTQSALDLFLIFAGANIVATTLQVGAAVAPGLSTAAAVGAIAAGSLFGAAVVGAIAPAGCRLGVPSIIATRAVLGWRGAGLVAVLLYVTNFAWIALNNVIAAAVVARAFPGTEGRLWGVALGLAATAVVSLGPTAVGRADRVAVPLMAVAGVLMTWACLRLPWPDAVNAGLSPSRWFGGFDVVVGYQMSWLLMFGDYSRYSANPKSSSLAVFAGLAIAALWFMPIGLVTARLAGSTDPGAMVAITGFGRWGALLVALATLTTNFVNIYMSALAWKSLRPATRDQAAIWTIGLVGTGLGLGGGLWLDRFADFMLVLGGTLVPVGGILLAHFAVLRRPTPVDDLYRATGPCSACGGWLPAGGLAWLAGTTTYYLTANVGATLPTLLVSVLAYVGLTRVGDRLHARRPAAHRP